MENTFRNVEMDEKNRYKSTKSHHQGIGLTNVKNAIQKYGGNLKIYTEDGLFKTEILIQIPNEISFQDS